MATIGNLIHSCMIENPTTLQVKAGTISLGKDDVLAFHRLMYLVSVTSSAGKSHTFRNSTNVTDGEIISIDISSAFQALADSYEYSPDTTAPPSFTATVTAWDEYMLNGEAQKTSTATASIPRSYMGRFSDLKRLKNPSGISSLPLCSSKPSTLPELAYPGETVAYVSSGQTTTFFTFPADAPIGKTYILGGHSYIIGQAPPQGQISDRYTIRFINTLGALESIAVTAYRETETTIQTEETAVAINETFGAISRSIVRKSADAEQWKLTSGMIDERWAAWYTHDFLMAELAWIQVQGTWVPCTIMTDETVTGINRSESTPLEIKFTVKLDIGGIV
mgnify:FL=1